MPAPFILSKGSNLPKLFPVTPKSLKFRKKMPTLPNYILKSKTEADNNDY